MISGYAATRGRGMTVRKITGSGKDEGSSWLGSLPGGPGSNGGSQRGVGRRKAGQECCLLSHTAAISTHPQQPPPKGSSLGWQEAKGGLQGHGQEGQVLGDIHGITAEASLRLYAPSACPALDLRSLHPVGYHHFAGSWCPGPAVILQLTSSSTGGGRRIGWAVWEGHFSLAHQFPVSKLSLQGPGCCTCAQHCGGLGAGLLLASGPRPPSPGWLPLGQRAGRPRSGSVCITRGQQQGLSGSNGRGRFPSPARSSKQRSGDTRVAGAEAARSAAPQQQLFQLRSLTSFLASPVATVSKPSEPWSAAASHPHVTQGSWLPMAQSP